MGVGEGEGLDFVPVGDTGVVVHYARGGAGVAGSVGCMGEVMVVRGRCGCGCGCGIVCGRPCKGMRLMVCSMSGVHLIGEGVGIEWRS